jgi:CRISPR-associated endonuclease Csn1
MAKILGLDLGMASVGFGLVDYDDQAGSIIMANSHIFEAAENPENGSSLAAPRRMARLARRVVHRRAVRKREIKFLLGKHALDVMNPAAKLPWEHSPNAWDLRRDALTRRLPDTELARILLHIAKRRGFQSNSKSAEANDDEGKIAKQGMKELEEKMLAAGARTIGAYLAGQEKKRNHPSEYSHTVRRDLLREEIKIIFAKQRELGNNKASTALEQAYAATAFFQRPIKDVAGMVGYCALEPQERRAPRYAYSSELFLLHSRLNNLLIKHRDGQEITLDNEQRQRIIALAHSQKEIKFSRLRKELELGDDATFNLVSYRKTADDQKDFAAIRKKAEDAPFANMKGWHALREILEPFGKTAWQNLVAGRTLLDEVARILSFYKDDIEIAKQLSGLNLSSEQVAALSTITDFKKTINLSLKAVTNILPFMQQGQRYDEACANAGYHHSQKENRGLAFLPPPEKTGNPVVDRALSQTCKVVNAIIRRYGIFDAVHIELARDMGKSFEDRKKIEREIKKSQERKISERAEAAETIFNCDPERLTSEQFVKYRLWKEQQGHCLYTGSYIEPQTLRDATATEIDHILPHRRSYDDSWMNKVLCLTAANREKGDKTPFEWLGGTKSWDGIEVMASKMPRPKQQRILTQNFTEDVENKWKSRHLNDTRFIVRHLKNHIEINLGLGEGRRVKCFNGSMTAHLRGAWGLHKNRAESDLHHAQDAIVLACATAGMIQKITAWSKQEQRSQGIEKPRPPLPWENFRADVKETLGQAFVSRMPVRKVTGEAHKATIKQLRQDTAGGRMIVQRIPLGKLTPDLLERMVDKPRNIRLYELLRDRLAAYGNKPDKAFKEPIYMPLAAEKVAKGQKPPIIRGINVLADDKSGLEVRGGIAPNGGMVRVDVFQKAGKYYLCPIYVAQLHANRKKQQPLPCKVITSGKLEEQWQELDARYDFCFSLFKNDLVRLVKGNGTEIYGYYYGTDRSNGAIHVKAHDASVTWRGNGVQNLKTFEKYTVDYFGNCHRVKQEKRQDALAK